LRDATHATSEKRSAKRDTVVHWFAAVVSGGVSSASGQSEHVGLLKIHFESGRRRRDDTSFASISLSVESSRVRSVVDVSERRETESETESGYGSDKERSFLSRDSHDLRDSCTDDDDDDDDYYDYDYDYDYMNSQRLSE